MRREAVDRALEYGALAGRLPVKGLAAPRPGGGCLFPTASEHNPTETIWMLSYGTADAIKNDKVNQFDSRDFG